MPVQWIELPALEVSPELLAWLRETQSLDAVEPGSPADKGLQILAQTLQRRGICSIEEARIFLEPNAYQPASPYDLHGMQKAVEHLLQALQSKETILVWGDFDVDGQTSTSLLVSALRQLGGNVRYHIPVREQESHGVNIPVLSRLLQDDSQAPVRLVLTCDTGISAVEAVDYAKQQGIQVLVTDHHEIPPMLPEALALVNPNFLPEEHPLHNLPGVGVAYKLAEALFQAVGEPEQVTQFLDLAALGCVADVAQLRGETRYLVQRGLTALSERKRLGLRLMLEAAEVPLGAINEQVISFTLAPRLNSLGRLSDANPVVDFLMGEDEDLARVFVARLEALNARRQLLTSQTFQGALAQLEREPELLDDPILVLSHPAWPAGVIGIVASRLVEQYGKPVIMLAAPPGEAARGSARSVEGFDITAALRWVQEATSSQPGKPSGDRRQNEQPAQTAIFYGFGGHSMAAGMSLAAERIPELRQRLRQAAQLQVLAQPALVVDSFLDFSEIDFDLVKQLERLAPFGAGNPPLRLVSRNLRVKQITRIGRGQEHLKLLLENQDGLVKEVLWWQSADLAAGLDLSAQPIDLAYELGASSFRGQAQLQLTWVDYRHTPLDEAAAVSPQRQVFDHRHVSHPLPILARLLDEQPETVIWAEAEAAPALRQHFPQAIIKDRFSLQPAPTLVVWSAPGSRTDLSLAINLVQPEQLHLFNIPPQAASRNQFLQRLTGLVKYALRTRDGQVELNQLAAVMGQSLLAVRLGLDWLVARGYIFIQDDQGEKLWLASAQGSQAGTQETAKETENALLGESSMGTISSPDRLSTQISALLDEAAAFRGYYGRAEPDTLIS